jgi:hypothetical protein
MSNISVIWSGREHTCAYDVIHVFCWGGNARGQLGDGTTTPRMTPRQVLF